MFFPLTNSLQNQADTQQQQQPLPFASQFDFGVGGVGSPPPASPLFSRFRPSALLAQLVRAATAGLKGPLTAAALENCTDLVELIKDLQDCVGVRYNPAEAVCQLLGKNAAEEGQQQPQAVPGARVVTKSCVKVKNWKN